MTFVHFKNRPASKSFNNFIDGFLPEFPSLFRDEFNNGGAKQFVPVNVKENEQGFVLEVIAPGLEKEDFKINLVQNLLTISAEKKNEVENGNEKLIRKEYKYQSFARSFTVDENVDADKIAAKYVNGVLTLNLPKKEEVKSSTKEISIQ